MQTRIDISADVLNWIMAQIGSEQLPTKVLSDLYQWAAGEKTPTFNQIEKASKATGIPLGYFFLKRPPVEDLSFVEYRTVDSKNYDKPSRNLIETMHDMEMIQDWMKEHLVSEGRTTIDVVGSMEGETRPEILAAHIRKMLEFGIDWYRDSTSANDSFKLLRNAISNAGVIVMMSGIVGNNTHRKLSISEFRAFSIVDSYAPLIFINATDSYNGRLFSLLHEFAHICIGQNDLYNDRISDSGFVKQTETVCNAAAAEVLVPQAEFLQQWDTTTQDLGIEDAIEALAKQFRCGTTVVARRALDNKRIDRDLYLKIANAAIKQYNKTKNRSGGDYYNNISSRIDQRFLGMLAGSVSEGKTLYSDAFRLTNTNRTTFATLIEKAGGVGT